MLKLLKNPKTLAALLLRLFGHIDKRRRYQFMVMMILALFSSVAEVVSLGAVLPFIGILTQPKKVFNDPRMSGVAHVFGINSPEDLVLPLTVGFAILACFAGGFRLLLLRVSIWLANATSADLSIDIYRRTLYQPYPVHVARSSSKIISGITMQVDTVTGVLVSLVTITTSFVLFVAILLTLFFINPMVAAVSVVGFGISYLAIAYWTRKRLVDNSKCIAQEQTHVVRALQEGLGAIRDVLLDSTQGVYGGVYRKAIEKLRRASGENSYIAQAPRFIMEALGIVLIAFLTLIMSYQQGGVGAGLPVLGVLALGAQRMLPLLQQIYNYWSGVMGSQGALLNVVELLDQPLPEDVSKDVLESDPLVFLKTIEFNNVYFRYTEDGPWVLNGVNITVPKGARVGFIGSTGSGKSTALDLLMLLLEPTKGEIVIDGQPIAKNKQRTWQRHVAHVPQSIYLADTSIAENIAFGVPLDRIDMHRVRQAAEQAQIAAFIENCTEGYNTFVGERGIRLSGGQRQRIGIARALYKRATVFVFDEATSALDNITENEVMRAIEKLSDDLTILIVAHRLTTLQNCDTIIKLERGKVVEQGSYDYFMKSDSSFQGLVNARRGGLLS